MRKVERWGTILGLTASMLYSQHGLAVVVDVNDVPAGQTITVARGDQVGRLGYVDGTLNLQGSMSTGDSFYFAGTGTLSNHGRIVADSGPFSIDSVGKIINHADGQIYVFGFMDMYSDQALFENAGLTVFGLDPIGSSYNAPWITYMIIGTIKNTGTMIFDRQSRGVNSCDQTNGTGYIVNEGRFYVESSTVCDFNSGEGAWTSLSYTQNGGETKVNGTFGVYEITINKGMLSGNGTIKGNFLNKPLADGVTIAPGAPQGTLSIVPDEGYVSCLRCSVDIELAGNTQSDQLHVEGELYMNGWKLNVLLRDGYVPTPGTRFSIVTATVISSSAATSNLPKLPNGRAWSVQNTGTEIILTAN